MSAARELLILRHGETEWNRDGRLQGEGDSPLTDRGLAQAEAQRTILGGLDVAGHDWYASPQGRAWRTASIANRDRCGPVTADARLREITLGDWAGLTRAAIEARAPHLFAADAAFDWYDHAPGGEGLAGVEARCADFLGGLTGPAVIVTHGITSRVLRCLALGLPADAFGSLDGGQGVVYRVAAGRHEKLTLQGAGDPG